ncbi:MAG: hypothetical protein KAZ85_00820, partial [Gammaproteobacteria bacterium]|nr:hypothetical protein [Gammaproteobacteria bacterium]
MNQKMLLTLLALGTFPSVVLAAENATWTIGFGITIAILVLIIIGLLIKQGKQTQAASSASAWVTGLAEQIDQLSPTQLSRLS